MGLGQLLAGAGVVGQGMREAENAIYRTRQEELRTAGLNRLDKLRQEMLRASIPEPVAVPQFAPVAQLPVAQSPVTQPSAPAAPAPAPAPAPAALGAKAQTFPVTPPPVVQSRPLTADETRQARNRIALVAPWALAADVVTMPFRGWADIAKLGARGINHLFGTELPVGEISSATPLYDKYVRQPVKELHDGTKRVTTVSGLPEADSSTQSASFLPRLWKAMGQVESSDNPNAVSPKNAIGVMQVQLPTAMDPGFGLPNIFDFVAQQTGSEYKGKRNAAAATALLKDPKIGAAYGQLYMNAMLKKYNGNLEYALAAYNMGPTKFDTWLGNGADLSALRKETRMYVPKVLAKLGMTPTFITGAPAAPVAGLNVPKAPTAPVAGAPAAPVAGLNVPKAPTAPVAGAPTAPVAGLSVPKAPTAPVAGAPAAPVAGVSTTPAPQLSASDFYHANPQSIPLDMQRAMQQRAEMERLAGMYQRAGMGAEFMDARAKLMELDNNMTYLQGMQGLQEFTLANDPRRLAAVWSQYAGVPVGIQPRTDGKFDVVVNGHKVKVGVSASDIENSARSAFDQTYRQQKGVASAEYNKEQFKTQLKIQENNAQQLAQMIRETATELAKGNAQLALEHLRQLHYDVKPVGDGTVAITPPNGGVPYIYNPSGRTIEGNDVKITSNSAVPIAGLPTFGGVKPE